MAKRAAIIDGDGRVANVTLLPDDYDPEDPGAWQPPEGCSVIDLDGLDEVAPEWTFDGQDWFPPDPVDLPPLPVPPSTEDLQAALDASNARIDALSSAAGSMLDEILTIKLGAPA